MKKLLTLALFVVAFLTQPASAQNAWFNAGANCSFNMTTGQCAVYNNLPRPVYCNIQIRGLVSSGAWFAGYQTVMVPPGQSANGYVYARNAAMDPLVDTHGSANCRF